MRNRGVTYILAVQQLAGAGMFSPPMAWRARVSGMPSFLNLMRCNEQFTPPGRHFIHV